MRRRSEHFGGVSYSTSMGCTFISGLIGRTTIFGNGLSRSGVGLKYVIFSQTKKREELLASPSCLSRAAVAGSELSESNGLS
jgi:hypothetical protein